MCLRMRLSVLERDSVSRNETLCLKKTITVFEFCLVLQEKIDALRVLGADVRPVPAVAFDNPQNYNHQVSHVTRLLPCIGAAPQS